MKTLIQAIEESCSKQGKSKSEITRLVLDSICKATDLQTSLSGLPNLEYLSLCNTNLVSLVGLPALPKLKVLKLSDNRIPGSHLEHLSVLVSSNLTHLDLAGNAGISKLEQLKPLSSLKQLKRLDLDGCPVKDNTPEFNKKLFEMIEELEYLDNIDKSGAERDAEEEEEEDDDEDYEEGDDGGAEGEEEVSDSTLITLTLPHPSDLVCSTCLVQFEDEAPEDYGTGQLLNAEPLPEDDDEYEVDEDEDEDDEDFDEGEDEEPPKKKSRTAQPDDDEEEEEEEDDEEDE
jgi:hypothetical protein